MGFVQTTRPTLTRRPLILTILLMMIPYLGLIQRKHIVLRGNLSIIVCLRLWHESFVLNFFFTNNIHPGLCLDKDIEFTVTAHTKGWMAVGFSDTPNMPNRYGQFYSNSNFNFFFLKFFSATRLYYGSTIKELDMLLIVGLELISLFQNEM